MSRGALVVIENDTHIPDECRTIEALSGRTGPICTVFSLFPGLYSRSKRGIGSMSNCRPCGLRISFASAARRCMASSALTNIVARPVFEARLAAAAGELRVEIGKGVVERYMSPMRKV